MVSLGGPALGLVMCIEENPSATSRLQWIALGFAGNNRVKTLVPDLRIAVVTESNAGICSVPKLPSRAKCLTRLKCRRRKAPLRVIPRSVNAKDSACSSAMRFRGQRHNYRLAKLSR